MAPLRNISTSLFHRCGTGLDTSNVWARIPSETIQCRRTASRAWIPNVKLVSDRIETGNEAEQVAALRTEIKRLLIREDKYPSKIVLMGDQTHQIVFRDALRDALSELQPIHGHTLVDLERTFGGNRIVNPVFASARGAAEMAKRAMESPPGGCLEAVHCYRERGE